jgi:dolichol-phosphate mannosyltransferase
MISVVTPIYNEQEILPELIRRTTDALNGCGGEPWELILVNDGSQDSSAQIIRAAHAADARVKLVELSRNFGHQPALAAGLHAALGNCVVLMDGDLQDPPELIPQFLQAWREGVQVVVGRRTSRSEGGGRGIGLRLFYPIIRAMGDLPAGPEGGIFGLLDRAVVDHLNRMPERNRFLPGLRNWVGFTQATVPYDRQNRAGGQPKQTLRRLVHYAMDAMFSFSYKPLRIATYMGFIVSAAAFALAVFYIVTFFTMHKQISGFTTTITCVLFLGGVQLVCTGILGEYIGRIYEEVKQRPLFIVRETLGFDGDEKKPT